ncbi:MAG: glycosyltransferase family 4 protein [Saprospiraceae bacterium]|nr:glycosyltransferase family 4 protein [Saprospiraceae bacterium]
MRRCKIAIVANSCWNIYNFRMELILHLAEMGHYVFVYAPEDHYTSKLKFPEVIHFQKLQLLEAKGLNPFRDILCLIELYRIFKNLEPDIVLNYTIKPNIYGSLAAGWLGIKAVSNLTGLGFTAGKPNLLRNVILQCYKWALSKNTEIVFHNEEDLWWFRNRKLIGQNRGKVISGSGVNAEHFKCERQRKVSTPFVFIFVGRTRKEKGIIEFLSAAEILAQDHPEIQFWIVGAHDHNSMDINTHSILNGYKNKGAFYFFGFEQDVRKRLSEANVFVLPSYREGRSKAMLEAMAMELPVITTSVAGCKQTIVQDVHGFIVPPKDALALSIAMKRIMTLSDEELSAMGKRCRQCVLDEFESKHIFAAYDEIIENAMKKSN